MRYGCHAQRGVVTTTDEIMICPCVQIPFDIPPFTRYNTQRCLMGNSVGRYRSGQPGQTVNLLTYVFAGSNPARPTTLLRRRVWPRVNATSNGCAHVAQW
jgi:hypothetical protein